MRREERAAQGYNIKSNVMVYTPKARRVCVSVPRRFQHCERERQGRVACLHADRLVISLGFDGWHHCGLHGCDTSDQERLLPVCCRGRSLAAATGSRGSIHAHRGQRDG